MPAIPLPKRKGKKAKQAENDSDADERQASQTTDALTQGYVAGAENEWAGARPNGKRISDQTTSTTNEGPFGDRHNINYSYPSYPIAEEYDENQEDEIQEIVSGESQVAKDARHINNPDDDPEATDDPKEFGWKRTIWEDVKVGDVIKVYEDEPLPAGMFANGSCS